MPSAAPERLRDGMLVSFDVPIPMDDGVVLRADIFRPPTGDPAPVLLTYGPYGKGVHFEDAVPYAWESLGRQYPETRQGTSNAYQCWEVVDPERWVPDGYTCVRIDSRGAGRSPGFLDPWSQRETQDLYDCIEWAADQPWSTGRVGLLGISYYAMNQWQVAARNPPHLRAMCAWEGTSDLYRDLYYHGGILSTFTEHWYTRLKTGRQHGLGRRGLRSRVTGELIAGPETLPAETLAANRAEVWDDAVAHPLFDAYWQTRVPALEDIRVPLLSAGNWGGQGLHLRGNIEGFLRAGSDQKWLEVHGGQHWASFYTDAGIALQKRFFGHFLKDEDTGWTKQPRVQLQVRHPGERFEQRHEDQWPPARTINATYHLHPNGTLSTAVPEEPATLDYAALGDGLTFLSEPLDKPLEITGHPRARLLLSSQTDDADVFLILRLFAPDMREVTFIGSNDPHTPVAHGWLRASRRATDASRSTAFRPFHTHDDDQPLTPGEVYDLDIEIWPTCIVAPAGYRIGLTVRGRDYVHPGADPQPVPLPGTGTSTGYEGVGPFRHVSGANRPAHRYGKTLTLHWRDGNAPSLTVPVVPTP